MSASATENIIKDTEKKNSNRKKKLNSVLIQNYVQ